jgi:hypothetical protein
LRPPNLPCCFPRTPKRIPGSCLTAIHTHDYALGIDPQGSQTMAEHPFRLAGDVLQPSSLQASKSGNFHKFV